MVAADGGHVMMGAAQIDLFRNQNISCIGDWSRPKAQLLGVRGAPGNTVNHAVSYWVPRAFAAGLRRARGHGLRDWVRPGGGGTSGLSSPNLAVLDFYTIKGTPDHAMRLRSVHPGVEVAEVLRGTGFELVVPVMSP